MGELITLNQMANSWFQDYANCEGGPELREAIARFSIGIGFHVPRCIRFDHSCLWYYAGFIYSFKRLLRNEPISGLELKGYSNFSQNNIIKISILRPFTMFFLLFN